MVDLVVTSVIAIGVVLLIQSRRAGRATANATKFGASIRRPGPGLSGRWRRGNVHIEGHSFIWRPRVPRTGESIRLTEVYLDSERDVARGELIWVNGACRIVRAATETGDIELAALAGHLGSFHRSDPHLG